MAALLLVLGFAVLRPHKWPEAAAAVPAAAVLTAAGAVPVSAAWAQVKELAPVVGFLAAVLVLAELCADDGLFTAAGAAVSRFCHGQPHKLLAGVFGVAALVTAVLSLDATVVLLTPVVLVTASRAGARARPHLYACAHLSNTGSLLLPVSNLTNLLAFTAAGVTFTRFAGLMLLPWLLAVGIEHLLFRRYFAADLAVTEHPPEHTEPPALPVFTLVVLALTLAGFAVTSLGGVNPAWAALAGALVLGARALRRGQATAGGLVKAAGPLFCLFVLALGVVVEAVLSNGLSDAADAVLPDGDSLPALLGVAAVAAVLANLINNLPATLALLPLAEGGGAGPVLAVLIGVNIGPNLTYAGSLATLLWRRVLHEQGADASLRTFTRLGLLTVPPTLVAATAALWAGLRVLG